MGHLRFHREAMDSPAVQLLIEALNAEVSIRYPEEGANHFRLDAEEVAQGKGAFFVGYADGEPVACGAVRLLDKLSAEIKRMYVVPEMRALGIGRALLAELEVEARLLGAHRLVLETGERQPEAIALYTRAGFAPIPPFGEYVDSPLSVCLSKELR